MIQEMGAGKESSLHIQRYKGLGEMTAEQLWDTTMSPDGRTLRQVTIENAAEADRIFSMTMFRLVDSLSSRMLHMLTLMLKHQCCSKLQVNGVQVCAINLQFVL